MAFLVLRDRGCYTAGGLTLFLCVTDIANGDKDFGLVTDCYISENARNRILREVANRAQKAVFDVAYSWCAQWCVHSSAAC